MRKSSGFSYDGPTKPRPACESLAVTVLSVVAFVFLAGILLMALAALETAFLRTLAEILGR